MAIGREGDFDRKLKLECSWSYMLPMIIINIQVQVPGGGPKSWSNYPSLLHSVESIAGHQAQTHWPSYDGLGRSALERTLALDGCVPMDRESLNHYQNTAVAVWTPNLTRNPSDQMSFDVPCRKGQWPTNAVITFTASLAKHSERDTLTFLQS
jgi:hypothetical protein